MNVEKNSILDLRSNKNQCTPNNIFNLKYKKLCTLENLVQSLIITTDPEWW